MLRVGTNLRESVFGKRRAGLCTAAAGVRDLRGRARFGVLSWPLRWLHGDLWPREHRVVEGGEGSENGRRGRRGRKFDPGNLSVLDILHRRLL